MLVKISFIFENLARKMKLSLRALLELTNNLMV